MILPDAEGVLNKAHAMGVITEWEPYLTRQKINDACLAYGVLGVIWYLRKDWKPERPTINYCWVVSEVALRLVMPKGTTCWRIDVDGHGHYHWFLKDPDKRIVDLTIDQAEGWWAIPDYSKATLYRFRPSISDRSKRLAELLGIIDENGKGVR